MLFVLRVAALVSLFLAGCGQQSAEDELAPLPAAVGSAQMNSLAVEYVQLALAFGQHDAAYVDAYYGPPEWRDNAIATPLTIPQIRDRTKALTAAARALNVAALSSIER